MADYTFAGPHGESLASGRPLAPGDNVPGSSVNPDDPHDSYLLGEGWLLDASPEPDQLAGDALKERARDLKIPNYSKLSADELRTAIAAEEAKR
jgi:hypothetical protein